MSPPDGPFGLRALWRAYRACRKGKRKARDTQRYEARLLDRLVSTRDAIAGLRWRPSPALSFVVRRPKLREIHAARFGDRVVHHLLVDRLERLWEPVFIDDSFANRRGKGTHAAVDRLQSFLRSASGGTRRPVYVLKLDIANCFNSIHRPTLFRFVQQRLVRAVRRQDLARDEARALQTHCRALLSAEPAAGVRRLGPPGLFRSVPEYKRLGALGPGFGLPVGNLTSQFFANVYLNELDQFVKHELKARGYCRYVDDFVLVHPDPKQLLEWRQRIADFLEQRLRLRLKEWADPVPARRGVDFLGYVVWPAHRVPRRRVVRHFHARLAAYERAHVGRSGLRLPPRARDRLRAQVASFRAHCRHASAAGVWQRTLERFPWLRAMFDHPENGSLAQSLRPRWNATSVSGLAGQYRALARRHSDACLLLEVGNRWLWPDSVARAAGQGGCGTAVLRPGLGRCREIAAAELPALCRRLRRAGQAYVLAAQTGHFRTGFRRREIVECWYPPTAAAAQALFSSTPRGER